FKIFLSSLFAAHYPMIGQESIDLILAQYKELKSEIEEIPTIHLSNRDIRLKLTLPHLGKSLGQGPEARYLRYIFRILECELTTYPIHKVWDVTRLDEMNDLGRKLQTALRRIIRVMLIPGRRY